MTRVLVFDGPRAAKRFELCRLALLSAGDGKGDRTRETVRKEARLLDALDSVSVRDMSKPADQDVRVVTPDSRLTLSQDDYLLLTQYLETTPWLPRWSREVVDVQDWVSAAEKVDA